jgi:inner membrane protein involved in colicin E2 resistance
MQKLLNIIIAITFTSVSHAQDTTGGTRPNIVIPLHKEPAEQRAQSKTTVSAKTTRTTAMTPDEIRIRNNSKMKKKAQPKKTVVKRPGVM